jgi:DNA-binding NtrC family response regulator
MSAQNTFMTAIKASETGAYDYLPKPFDLTELIAIVGRALSEPKRKPAPKLTTTRRTDAAGRPLGRHAGHLPRAGAPDADRPDA